MLTFEQKRERVITSEANLALFNSDPKAFLDRFVTVDEMWRRFTTSIRSSKSKRAKVAKSAYALVNRTGNIQFFLQLQRERKF